MMMRISVPRSSRWVEKLWRRQRHALLDPGCVGRPLEKADQLAGGHRLTMLPALLTSADEVIE
jgi:hypothetical protein